MNQKVGKGVPPMEMRMAEMVCRAFKFSSAGPHAGKSEAVKILHLRGGEFVTTIHRFPTLPESWSMKFAFCTSNLRTENSMGSAGVTPAEFGVRMCLAEGGL